MNAFSRSWELVKASARVLQADKELTIFPIVSSIATLIVSVLFFVPMFSANLFDSLFMEKFQILGVVVMFFFYLAQYFVIIFCNTALVGAAIIRLRGGDPTVRDGFRIAFSHLGSILGYAAIAATVGMILKAFSDRTKGVGRMVISLIGMAWNVATFLVVPVLAVEGIGPIDAVKRSVALLRRTWGEQIVGNMGLGAVFGLATLGLILLGGAIIALVAIQFQIVWLAITLGVLLVLALVLLGLIQSTLSGIYTAAVYQFAVDGQAGSFFDEAMVRGAFRIQ